MMNYCAENRKIIFEFPKQKLNILSNQNMLLHIFDNLICNVLKHGKEDLTITVEETESIKIIFKNELISPDIDKGHIFDEFYTMDISQIKGNKGLELAIVKKFTETLNGSIYASLKGDNFILTVNLNK